MIPLFEPCEKCGSKPELKPAWEKESGSRLWLLWCPSCQTFISDEDNNDHS